MPASTTIEVVGVKQTINSLRKIDPQLQKDFKADATAIAQPAINAGKAVYKDLPLSGMRYAWTQNAVGVILIEQKDVAAAVFETAGRANANKLGNALGFVGAGRTRLIGPAVYKARRGIEAEMTKMIAKTMRTVQSEL